MKENGSDLEEIIREELQKEAEDIRETVESSEGESLSEDRKEKIRENLQNEIQAYEKEKVYEQLSQEDREALELGRQIQRERQEDGKKKGGRRIWKIALNLAAALVLVSVLGITSLGGPERIVEMVRTMVGDREVVKVNSDEDNLKIAEEREEEEDIKNLNYFDEDNVIYVRYVIPGSAAAKAGLKPMDKIVTILGIAAPNTTDAKGDYEEILEENLTSSALGQPVEIQIERKGKLKTLTLKPDNVCPYDLKIAQDDPDINAYADGEDIYLTLPMIDYMQGELELAAVMAHELAHNTLGHSESKEFNAAIGALAGGIIDGLSNNMSGSNANLGAELGSKVYSKDFEFEADYLSVYSVARAGYNYKPMSTMQKKLAARYKDSIYFSSDTHPKPQERSALMIEAAKEIDMKKNFKEPLLPDFAKSNSHLENKKDDTKWF